MHFPNPIGDTIFILYTSFFYVFVFFYITCVIFNTKVPPNENTKEDADRAVHSGYVLLVNIWGFVFVMNMAIPIIVMYDYWYVILIITLVFMLGVIAEEHWFYTSSRRYVRGLFLRLGELVCLNGRFVDYPNDDGNI